MTNHVKFSFPKNTPRLDIGKLVGDTHYIDFIQNGTLTDPCMVGTDVANRPFFVIRLVVEYGSTTKYYTQTFFQRYTDDSILWMGCGDGDRVFVHTHGGINPVQTSLIQNIINGKQESCDPNDTVLKLNQIFRKYHIINVRMMYREELESASKVRPVKNTTKYI